MGRAKNILAAVVPYLLVLLLTLGIFLVPSSRLLARGNAVWLAAGLGILASLLSIGWNLFGEMSRRPRPRSASAKDGSSSILARRDRVLLRTSFVAAIAIGVPLMLSPSSTWAALQSHWDWPITALRSAPPRPTVDDLLPFVPAEAVMVATIDSSDLSEETLEKLQSLQPNNEEVVGSQPFAFQAVAAFGSNAGLAVVNLPPKMAKHYLSLVAANPSSWQCSDDTCVAGRGVENQLSLKIVAQDRRLFVLFGAWAEAGFPQTRKGPAGDLTTLLSALPKQADGIRFAATTDIVKLGVELRAFSGLLEPSEDGDSIIVEFRFYPEELAQLPTLANALTTERNENSRIAELPQIVQTLVAGAEIKSESQAVVVRVDLDAMRLIQLWTLALSYGG